MSFRLTAKRRFVQALSVVLLNSNFWGAATQGVCLPVLNCEACAISWLGCPIGLMSGVIAFHEFPLLVVGIVVGLGLLFGRLLCGWVCPTGFVQDLLYKIPTPKWELPRFMFAGKYVFLAVTVVVVAYYLGKEPLAFFCQFCPTAAVQVALPTMIADRDFAVDAGRVLRFSVLGIVLVGAVASRRSFCKAMCPVGALVALTNRFTVFSLRLHGPTCIRCKACNRACPMDVRVMESQNRGRAVNRDLECIECLTCEAVCPTRAITNNSRLLKAETVPGSTHAPDGKVSA